jgi:hypothetical protein
MQHQGSYGGIRARSNFRALSVKCNPSVSHGARACRVSRLTGYSHSVICVSYQYPDGQNQLWWSTRRKTAGA